MGIYLPNMEMPKNCGECPFIFTSWGIEYYCHLAESSTSAEYVGREKMTNCPLIELPPHGRLIDIKSVEYGKFTTVGNDYQRWWNGALESVIDNAPTVIEAEGSEE